MERAPCKDCIDRKLYCYSSCKKYIEFQNKNNLRREEQAKNRVLASSKSKYKTVKGYWREGK